MSSVECLREFVNERLTAAAEEIFGVFRKTIVEYEEEICRQRRLLDIVWKPEIKLHRIELPQQHVCKEEEVLADQQLCIQERNSSLDQEDPEPPQIKEEQEELCSRQEGEQLVLKQETDTFMLTPAYEESDRSEPEPKSDHQLVSHDCHVAESQDQKGGKHEDSGSTRDAEPKQKNPDHKRRSHSNNVHKSTMSEIHRNPHAVCTSSRRSPSHRRRWRRRCGRGERSSKESSHSNMSVRRRRFSLTSSSVFRRGTPVWTKRTQSLHRLKRNRRNSVAGRRESSLY
ncbi:uncharacterized protein LOC122882270 isoform X5 [Siniperca chuatsi]|uniref:uncharacterized protein LOC122882270 isoform X5 n=1 Tax=Siniperca chuatsi TaxID=119488 RepID=UPI001CE08FC4|nr:uncharacterized protein LOC122882270 isoform X5 [Siniperca chuatsi]